MNTLNSSKQLTGMIISSLGINISEGALDFLTPLLQSLSTDERKKLLQTLEKKIEEEEKAPILTRKTLINLLLPNETIEALLGGQSSPILDKNQTKKERKKHKEGDLSKFLGKKERSHEKREIGKGSEEKENDNIKTSETSESSHPFHDPIVEFNTGELTASKTKTQPPKADNSEAIENQTPNIPKFEELDSIKRLRSADFKKSFSNFFRDRYKRIERILKRKKLKNLITTKITKEETLEGDHSIILLITSKRIVKNGKGGIIKGHDKKGTIKLFVPLHGRLKEKFNNLLNNTVIAFNFHKSGSGLPIVDDILFPNVPYPRERHRSSNSTKVLFLSDLHIGSKDLLTGVFNNFIDFIRGKAENKNEASEIDYIFVTGDLVDGTGVYPNQKEELKITNVEKQYEMLNEYLKSIPEEIRIILIPGNHDAAGRLLPQPPSPFLKNLNELPNVSLLSNPAFVEVEGVQILLFHGHGFEGIAGDLGVGINAPSKVTTQVLKHRHLSPIWENVSTFPTEKDHLVIEKTPDIMATGHLHVADYKEYKGTLLLNPSAFQGRTSWQRELGIEPTPGLFPLVDLQNFNVKFLDFTET